MATLFRRPQNSRELCQCFRTFSTSTIRPVNLQWQYNDPDALADALPAYPYGPTRWYKQSRHGLYGGQRIRFGNNVSDEFEIKTRRSWHPNIKTKKLHSKALGRYVQVRVSTRVLKTIDKLGGLDEYLLGEKSARIQELGESGWWLRWAIMQTPVIQKRFAKERQALGLLAPPPAERLNQEDAIAPGVVEPSAEELTAEEAAEAIEEGEVLGDDGAVSVDALESDSLPALRWRVGPGQHLVLTSEGWRRVREDPSRRIKLAEERTMDMAKEKATDMLRAKDLRGGQIRGRLQEYKRRIEAYNSAMSLRAKTGIEGGPPARSRTLYKAFEGRPVQDWEQESLVRDAQAKWEKAMVKTEAEKMVARKAKQREARVAAKSALR